MRPEWRERLRRAQASGPETESKFFADLNQFENDAEVIDFLLTVLEELKAEDGALIPIEAAAQLVRRRDPAALPRLLALRPNLPPIAGLRDYRENIDQAIAIWQNAAAGKSCNCDAYGQFNTSPYQDDLEIKKELQDDSQYFNTTLVYATCKLCGQNWVIEINGNYHYPISTWRLDS